MSASGSAMDAPESRLRATSRNLAFTTYAKYNKDALTDASKSEDIRLRCGAFEVMVGMGCFDYAIIVHVSGARGGGVAESSPSTNFYE